MMLTLTRFPELFSTFDIIARSASEAGVAIDVFCTGALELGYPATKRYY
jgi:hypothetical protein